jgi:uncharacterized membrane protein YbaN (DUF454 family)
MHFDETATPVLVKNKILRIVLLVCGFFFVFLAILGAILPLVPTTPFLIVAAACFYRSSARFYRWLMFNRFFGHYLRDYTSGKGIPMRVKILTVVFLWISTAVSILVFIPYLWLEILVFLINLAVTIHIFLVRTKIPD